MPHRLVVIGRMYVTASTIHTVSLENDFARVCVEEVRHVDVKVPLPTSEVRFVVEVLGTFIVWPTHLLKVISKKHEVYCHNFT